MEILLALLGIPIGIFANISTDFLVNKFKKINPKNILMMFNDSMVQGVEEFDYRNYYELEVKTKILEAIRNDVSKLTEIFKNIEYDSITIQNLRSHYFKNTIQNSLADIYDLPDLSNSKIGERIINNCLYTYDKNFFTAIIKKDSDKFLINKLSKINNGIAKKEDIEALRKHIIENFNADGLFEDQTITNWIFNEIKNVETDIISDSIQLRMRQLDKIVDYLTEDQKRILDYQKYHNQLLVKGCAGSGKTIVAAEKAIRLAQAGFKVLMICHNPYLANHIEALVENTGVSVFSFSSLISKYTKSLSNFENDWSIFIEPTIDELERAFDNILLTNSYYDAIIVDEGQDFRDEWWPIIDALLEQSKAKILYIFSDDHQAFNNIKTKYPLKESKLNLSKNVRNAGNIYELIKQFHPDAPPTTAILENYGITKIENLEQELLIQQVLDTINESSEFIRLQDLVILTMSDQLENSLKLSMENENFLLSNSIDNKVTKLLEKISWMYLNKPIDFVFRMPLDDWQKNRISQLVRNCERNMPKGVKRYNGSFFWKRTYNKLNDNIVRIDHDLYEINGNMHILCDNPISILSYFNSIHWSEQLPSIQEIRINNGKIILNQTEHIIPISPITNYKGLEAKGIILIVDRPIKDLETFLYVGISRAVYYLKILIDRKTIEVINRTGRKLDNKSA